LLDDAERIAAAAGRPIVLEAIAVARPQGRTAPAPLIPADDLIQRPGLDAIVELIGGLEPAHTYINRALEAGRQVITANKQVVATFGPALAQRGPLRFEASVASAILIIEVLGETLAEQRISAITAILNGTTNSMLEAMAGGTSYADALADAQHRGLAEADPSADVDAHDPAAKLAILAMLAFRRRVDPSTIERVGIRDLNVLGPRDPRSSGYVIKLIAAARRHGDGIMADVRPRLIPPSEPMARVGGAMNAIAVDTTFGSELFEGPGAGPEAASSGVLADLIRAARDEPASAGMLLATLADEPFAVVAPLGSPIPYPAVK
jgi:homoserine dehydrogenase